MVQFAWLLLFLHAEHGKPMIQPSHLVRRWLHRSQALPFLRPLVAGSPVARGTSFGPISTVALMTDY